MYANHPTTSISSKRDYRIVFNLNEPFDGLFIPQAFVVSLDLDGLPTHIQQKALPDTISAYGLEADEVITRLFELTEALQPQLLSEKFSPPKKKPKAVEVLWADRDTRRTMQAYIDRRLSEWLRLIETHGYQLSWNAERKVLVNDLLLDLDEYRLEPRLFFEKTDEGVIYRLLLGNDDQFWRISQKDVRPITNEPAWLFVDWKLVHLPHVKGHMVRPFQQKDEVRIPAKAVRTYFEKFIMKVAEKVEVEAEGFDILQFEQLKGCQLIPVQDFFKKRWGLAVHFDYEHTSFEFHEKRMQRSRLQFNSESDIRILQISRDKKAEKKWLGKLRSAGLTSQDTYFGLEEEGESSYALLEWLSRNRQDLEAGGFVVREPVVEEKQVALAAPGLVLGLAQDNDWFDLKGEVVIDGFRIPFQKLARYIREGNRFYKLPDGRWLLIPEEWFARFGEVLSFTKQDDEGLRLQKSQYMLLREAGLEPEQELEQNLPEEVDPSPRLKASLRPYQLTGFRWLIQLYHQGLGACLADDMGLGKTLQTIAALLYAKEEKERNRDEKPTGQIDASQLDLFNTKSALEALHPLQALIVLPASLVFNWQQELQKFAPHLSVYAHIGPKRNKKVELLQRWDIILSTYQTVLRDVDVFEQLALEYIVLDESQQIKNRNSKVFKAINRLEGAHKISLSGTPIENSLSDLWSQMQFINPDLLGSYAFFKREFITPIERQRDDERKDRLRRMVAPYLLRRTKEEVAPDLPELTSQVFWCEMTPDQRKLYEKEKSAARNFLLDNFVEGDIKYRAIVVKTLTRLRQLANHPRLVEEDYQKESGKFKDVLEHWEQVRKSGHKALFFSSMVSYLEMFRQVFEAEGQPSAWLSGATSSADRARQVKTFQQDPDLQSFLISIKAGGTGLNLTAADYVFILDPWWNPFIEQQAISRAHRIGQDKNVIALKFITRESLEEKILRLQARKTKLAEDILGVSSQVQFTREELEFLLE